MTYCVRTFDCAGLYAESYHATFDEALHALVALKAGSQEKGKVHWLSNDDNVDSDGEGVTDGLTPEEHEALYEI